MCGIVGIYSLKNLKIENLDQRLRKMLNLIKYRGPDNEGFYTNSNKTFGMANNQLSIVSPNKKIKLPITYNNNTFLSFNGEIYNYLDLKSKFKVQDKNFKYKTDTEILYHLLNQKNQDLSVLNGVWAFAYYDYQKHILTLGRDQLGERNLYYYRNGHELIFASEIRPIFAATNINYTIDNDGIQDMWKFYACRDNKTIIKNCFKIKPGYSKIFKLKADRKGNEISLPLLSIEKYLDFCKKSTEKKIFKKFNELFRKELILRFPSKVKLTSLLSGGIDSSFLNIMLSKYKSLNTIYAVSSYLNYQKYLDISEYDLSKFLAKKISSKHDIVELRENFYAEALRTSKNSLETLDPSILNFSLLSKNLKKMRTKVVFASDGPDEFLGGYSRDISNFINRNNYLEIPQHKILKDDAFYKDIFESVTEETKFFSEPDKRYKKLLKSLDPTQIKALTYATKSLPEFTNIRADKGFMLNSIEVRQPFLSKSIVEFLCALPQKYRINDIGEGKIFLRNSFNKKFEKILKFKKMGFGKNLISDYKVNKKLSSEISETICDDKMLKKLNFKRKAKNIFLNSNSSQKYMLFSAIRSLKNLST